MAGGRPTKYRDELCAIAENSLSKGFSLTATCADLDCCKDTVYEWMDKHPEFSDAIKRGKQKGQKYFENIMMHKITGKITDQFDPKKSDTTLLIFALKTRFHKDFGNKDKVEVDHGEIKITISEDDQDL